LWTRTTGKIQFVLRRDMACRVQRDKPKTSGFTPTGQEGLGRISLPRHLQWLAKTFESKRLDDQNRSSKLGLIPSHASGRAWPGQDPGPMRRMKFHGI
jgi:hypothetical protein